MKHTILFLISATLSTFAFAQRQAIRAPHIIAPAAARTTTAGDTTALTNISSGDTLTMYSYPGGGYVTGPNTYGDMGFAERYTTTSGTSAVIIGVMTHFGGTVNPASTQSVNLKIWSPTAQVAITGSLAYRDLPNLGQDTVTVPVTQLGIGTTVDTVKSFFFPRRTDTVQGSFYVGYDMNYHFSTLNGDTIGLYSTLDGNRSSSPYSIVMSTGLGESTDTTYDTVINVQNATLWSDNVWHDNFTANDTLFNNLAIFPIVVLGNPTGVGGVVRNGLTFFGNYPNPANDVTNIRYSLDKQATVTLTLMDMQGRVLQSQSMAGQTAGEHTVQLSTAQLVQGNYLCSLITSNGDAIATRITVAR